MIEIANQRNIANVIPVQNKINDFAAYIDYNASYICFTTLFNCFNTVSKDNIYTHADFTRICRLIFLHFFTLYLELRNKINGNNIEIMFYRCK